MDTLNSTISFISVKNSSNNFSVENEILNTESFDKHVHVNKEFKPIIDYLLLTVLILIMLAMGCEITWSQLKAHMLKPIGIGIGLVSQFLIMPLTAYALLISTGVTGLHATGVLIISCCPGGVLSNVFSYFCEGDLSLSVAMTTFSTLMALGMMPLNLWIYGRSFETEDLSLPYANLALSLVSITAPVGVGMFIGWKLPKISHYVTKVGSYIGIILVIICVVLQVLVFPDMFTDVPGKLYGIILTLPFTGMFLGYMFSFLFRQNKKIRKTVAIECGIQNVPSALTVITLSFQPEHQGDIILLPWLYGFAMISTGTILSTLYQIYLRYLTGKKEIKARKLSITDDLLKETTPI